MKCSFHYLPCRGFTRSELLATLVALSLVVFTTIGMTRADPAHAAACHNSLRQLGIALLHYSDDNDGKFPTRVSGPSWPERLRPYYKQLAVLTCPSDGLNPRSLPANSTNVADAAPRSYLLNGWNDYFVAQNISPAQPFPECAISEPSQTILFGEKATESSHFWFDYLQGDDLTDVESGRHYRSGMSGASGASNHAFADGSVRLLKWGAAFNPVNLWAVEPAMRRFEVPQ